MAFLHVRLAYQILKHKTAVLRSKKGSEMKDLFWGDEWLVWEG